ncbi:M23 family metallopeptidase [Virgibacillus oceani]|uniref:M23 family metallopeptidase n=1 Tax=Virgibacillus oceani TaxID=1479511 RepID=UPI001E2FD081|nr:M23 family metallopeptidase [Virgibacillus oceani]
MKSSIVALIAAGILPFSAMSGQSANLMGDTGTIEISQRTDVQKVKKKDRILPEEFNEVFLQGDYSRIYRQTTEQFQQNVSLDDFEQLAESFNQGVTRYNLETSFRMNKHMKRFVWVDGAETRGVQVVFGKHGTIQLLQLAPLASYPETDQLYTDNKYSMPINDEWFVFWGGTNQFINYHYVTATQRYAYDLVMMKNGSTHHGNPKMNKHYYAFGEEVLAPADGEVIEVVNDINDNIPGGMNSEKPLGNHVIIKHENGEYSLLAHFKKNSIVVKPGDHVEKGELLGQCGNSGNSSEPHIHFQVMDSPNVFEGNSIRIQFEIGEEPIQGDFVR